MAQHITDNVSYDQNRWHCQNSLADLLKGFKDDLPLVRDIHGGIEAVREVWFRKDGKVTFRALDGEFFTVKRSAIVTVIAGSNRTAGSKMRISLAEAMYRNGINLI